MWRFGKGSGENHPSRAKLPSWKDGSLRSTMAADSSGREAFGVAQSGVTPGWYGPPLALIANQIPSRRDDGYSSRWLSVRDTTGHHRKISDPGGIADSTPGSRSWNAFGMTKPPFGSLICGNGKTRLPHLLQGAGAFLGSLGSSVSLLLFLLNSKTFPEERV